MDRDEFVAAIKMAVRDSAIRGVISCLEEPPGRTISDRDKEMSNWYISLSDREKTLLQNIVMEGVDLSLFSYFCVLDGVQEFDYEKGELELYYIKGDEKRLLNDVRDEFLHDLFSHETRDENWEPVLPDIPKENNDT